jgi:predicted dehydrogenase
MSTPRIGVVGTGWWATQHHIPSLATYAGAELTCLADSDTDKLKAAAERFGVTDVFGDHIDLIGSGLVDGVVVATPHSSHYAIARGALDAGLHVLVEKPMVLKATEAWDLVERADAGNLHLLVGYTFHYTEHARIAREIVRSGAIGDLKLVSGVFASIVQSFYAGDPEAYRGTLFPFPVTAPRPDTYSDPSISGGGQGQTQMTHALGMALWVTGANPLEGFAYMESHSLHVDLVDALAFRLDENVVGTLASTGTLQPGQPQQQGWTYYGTDGFLVQDMVGGRLSLHRNDGSDERFPDLREDETYPAEAPARALADLIAGSGDNRSPASSAAHVVELLECAYRSADLGRPVRVHELNA